MNILEADYGLGPLRDVEATINSGIARLFERNKSEPWFDGLWMNEYGEVLHGSLLVAGQAYCVGSVADVNSIRESEGLKTFNKIEAYQQYPTSRNGHSVIEFINAAANCFKHRDEWGNTWPNNLTTKTLAAFRVTSTTEFPLNEVFDVIQIELKYGSVCELLSGWLEGLIDQIKQKS